ncbi:hypothetical protein [Thiorhodovibrio winogradskyi]|uniref:hypothetical protein n=1 Tax=Thiorhodovibrio winogradskyi TaxID=77007 RepID=UPI002E2E6A6D|nr:hypothetical protein [Thiorhodovibrio winogradskyi]
MVEGLKGIATRAVAETTGTLQCAPQPGCKKGALVGKPRAAGGQRECSGGAFTRGEWFAEEKVLGLGNDWSGAIPPEVVERTP